MRYLTISALALVLALGVFLGCQPKEEKPLEPTMTVDDAKTKLADFMNAFDGKMKAITADETLKPEEGFPKLLEVVKADKTNLDGLAEEFKAIENIPEEAQADYDGLNAKVEELAGAFAALEEAYATDFAKIKPEDLEAWAAKVDEAMGVYKTVGEYCGAEVPGEEVVEEEGATEEKPGEEKPAEETPAKEGGE